MFGLFLSAFELLQYTSSAINAIWLTFGIHEFWFCQRKQSFPGQNWILSIFASFLQYLEQNSITFSFSGDYSYRTNILITYIWLSAFFSRASGGMTWRRTLLRSFSLQLKPSGRHCCSDPVCKHHNQRVLWITSGLLWPRIRQNWGKSVCSQSGLVWSTSVRHCSQILKNPSTWSSETWNYLYILDKNHFYSLLKLELNKHTQLLTLSCGWVFK